MQYRKLISSLLISPLLFGNLNAPGSEPLHIVQTKGFALVELYTSEGCSSCPPADDLVGKLSRTTE
ncbi:MAG TPA: DUF1223 domain-containing protein, partial [Chitinophagaceae bacterium]